MAEERIRNEYGEVVHASHPERRGEPAAEAFAAAAATPTQIADSYLSENLEELGLGQSRLAGDEAAFAEADEESPVISFSEEKGTHGSTVVVYEQAVQGLKIFDARMGVHIDASERNVTAVQSSMHARVDVVNAEQKKDRGRPEELAEDELRGLLGLDLENLADGRIYRQLVYRFEPEERVERNDADDEPGGCFGGHAPPPLDLPELPARFEKGEHYVVDEVLFKASRQSGEAPVNWRALVEPGTRAVLYLRALVSNATGLVFVRDPQTQSGAAVTGASTDAVLNPFRSSVSLAALTAATPQPLSGHYVELAETSAPVIAAPTAPNPASTFNFNVRTDDFAAVNAYHHCDNLFRTMEDYGFDVHAYFDGTSFPVPVDHRALGNTVNAEAPGNALGNGLGELRFALLQAGQPVGMATSNRVVWHEFGHGLLWDNVSSPNFGFAHSAGDSLAAILNDPGSQSADRFNTFPWVSAGSPFIDRRHNRAIADGWAWFGPQYNTQYQGEQILSTTLFRFYRSIGGDAGSLGTQRRAAQAAAYLIFKAIGLLVSTTAFPEVFVTALQNADRTTTEFKGIAGGALHKVVRWAFEKQGLFQPGAQPGQGNAVDREGDPPDVDVYIDDGRNGEYPYLANHWSCQDMWVRRSADGGLAHQQPVVGQTNYMYVRVKNRGTQTAQNVRVDTYHCLPGTGLAFPDDWTPMSTPTLAVGVLASGGDTVVGPFAFVPTEVGHECLLAIAHADDDPGNDTTLTGTIPESRFVPFDNNVGQRNVHPVLPSLKEIVKTFREHRLWIRNPLRRTVVCRLDVKLPGFLRRRGWELRLASEGGAKFELGPHARREVTLALDPGEDFPSDEARRAAETGDHRIEVLSYLDDELSGGMTYPLSFDAEGSGREDENGDGRDKPHKPRRKGRWTIEEILEILRGKLPFFDDAALGRSVRTIRIELDLREDGE